MIKSTYLTTSALSILASTALYQAATQQNLPTLTPEQKRILDHMSIEQMPDGLGGTLETIRISGVNVQIVNGLTTDTVNGLGNLFVGYNEGSPTISGSHSVVIGVDNSITSYAGLVAGESNSAEGAHNVVFGRLNTAAGLASTVTGGTLNRSISLGSSVAGGFSNVASGPNSTVTGGEVNTAAGSSASVSGGQLRSAPGTTNWSGGGLFEFN